MKSLIAYLLIILVIGASACSGRYQDRDTVYLVSSIHALVEGLFDGEVTIGEVKQHGNMGIGAVDAVDGELVLVDGIAYQVKADGTVTTLADQAKTPYAIATFLNGNRVLRIDEPTDFNQLTHRLDIELGNSGLPFALRMEGAFSYVKTRSVPRQVKPYPRLIELIKRQPEFEFNDVQGVIVGFRLPEHLESLAVPGYHFHFLTADRKSGGHLLAFRARTLLVAADASPEVHTVFPQSRAFAELDITRRSRAELDQIMGRTKP